MPSYCSLHRGISFEYTAQITSLESFASENKSQILCFGFIPRISIFKLQNIYNRIPILVRIPIYSSELVERALHYLWFVLTLVFNGENKPFIIARLTMWGCLYNERTNCLRMYKRLLTNHLHGKATELCLANS